MRVLITGAAGSVGSVLVAGLKDRYELRGFDRVPMPELTDTVVGDISDYQTVLKAMEEMDAVIHLAGVASGAAPWADILQNNFIGTYNIFEAARECGVKRIAFASRAGLLGPYPGDQQRTVDLVPRPTSYYSISKAFGENLGYMYSAQHDMEIVCVRIGNFKLERDGPEHPHQLSHGDAVRVFEQAIIYPDVKYEVVFGVSDSNWPLYDMNNVIGYEPQDFADVPEDQRT